MATTTTTGTTRDGDLWFERRRRPEDTPIAADRGPWMRRLEREAAWLLACAAVVTGLLFVFGPGEYGYSVMPFFSGVFYLAAAARFRRLGSTISNIASRTRAAPARRARAALVVKCTRLAPQVMRARQWKHPLLLRRVRRARRARRVSRPCSLPRLSY
jgi:hypothetical protein